MINSRFNYTVDGGVQWVNCVDVMLTTNYGDDDAADGNNFYM